MHSENEEDEITTTSICPKMKPVSKLSSFACRYDCLICEDIQFLDENNNTKRKNTHTSNIVAKKEKLSLRTIYETIKNTVKGYPHIYSAMRQHLKANNLTDHWLETHMRRDPACINHVETSLEFYQKLEEHDRFISETN